MLSKDLKKSRLKQKLLEKKQRGYAEVEMKLSQEHISYIQNVLNLPISPCRYKIETNFDVPSIKRNTPEILKEIHRARKHSIQYLYRDLSSEDKEILKKCGISFIPIRHRIVLN